MTRLTPEQWRAIRQAWEFNPDELSYTEAARLAAKKHGFKAPSKTAIGKRVKAEGWGRRGFLDGINQAAHRIADRMGTEAQRKPGVQGGGAAYNDPGVRPDSLAAEFEERSAAERRRAEIRVRHRKEWEQVASLRQDALKHMEKDLDEAFQRLKIGKLTAEVTNLQQSGECRAWGMDELICATQLKTMTDQQLEALVAGKKVS